MRLLTQQLKTIVVRRFASRTPRFSESTAYFGKDKMGPNRGDRRVTPGAKFEPDYYSSSSWGFKKFLSVLGSLGAVVAYFGFLSETDRSFLVNELEMTPLCQASEREPSDLDKILDTPAHILTANLERRMLREEIERERKAGRDTSLLEAKLEYVDVKEAALKLQFEKTKK
ncbi:hypothetical protein L596_020325 [Steinernema carpocapsae]|uniref:Uncharacterized protein n=1 Tax=Steinernema carpocapsae TaxID=34508 RepID=A0A4U5MT68_STECR|nr:hypothetical protein L596_020325 [Steinernema carpocapsae]